MEVKCAYTKLVELDKLIEHPRNDNNHLEKHANLLAKFMKTRGIRHPIIVSKKSGFIVAGHLRLWAAKILGLENFPVDEQDFENEADEYAFLSGDNNVARYAEFDKDKMLNNLEELDIDLMDFDFEEVGLIEFDFQIAGEDIDEDENNQEENIKHIVEVTLGNDMEKQDLYDDLISKGYAARIK